ncbi:hypothetical protein [Oscillibacter sp. 1-3]|nr:hypothetical protein [Oscillibacter sp. 1-3]
MEEQAESGTWEDRPGPLDTVSRAGRKRQHPHSVVLCGRVK